MITISDTLAKNAGQSGDVVDAAGYYVAGDGGGGRFRWDPQSQAVADGGLVVAPSAVGSGPGRWLREHTIGLVDVRWFGAWGGPQWVGETEYSGTKRPNADAFEAAIRCLAPATVPTYFGPRVVVPPGRYTMTRTLVVDRAAHLDGVGSEGMSSSWLEFPKDVDGVRIFRDLPPSTPGLQPPLYQRPRGDLSTLSRLRITGQRGSGGHGVRVEATCRLIDIYVQGFEGNGVHADCSVPSKNANACYFERVRVNDCHDGFFFDGSDSNACNVIACNATSCRGWGINDNSFLGNYVFGFHSASCFGPFRATNPNARSVFVGCYSEGDQAMPHVHAPSLVVGGISGGNAASGGFLGEGFGALRLRRNQAFFDVDADPANPVRVTLGSSGVGGTALELVAGANGQPYRVRYDGGTPPGYASRVGWWALEFAGLTAGAAMRWCTSAAAEWSRGLVGPKVSFDQGYMMGRGVRTLTSPGTAAPTTGTWARGDRVINQSPAAGGYIGWVCVQAGTPGVWKPYGKIEQ